jgi:integrase/recombinase XerD
MSALSPRAGVLPPSLGSVAGESPRRGTLIADSELAARALEVAESQAVTSTRDTYASTYAAFVAFLHARTGCPPRMHDFDLLALIAYRDHLAGSGRSSATIAKHLSALRTLAGALALDPAIAQVKSKQVPRPAPRSLTVAEYNGLVALPKLNARRGRRDHAILRVLGECGMRRSELVELTYHDIEKAPRLEDPELRRAMAHAFGSTTIYVLRIRDAKTPDGARTVPLSPAAYAALEAWTRNRPTQAISDHVFLSLPKHPDLNPSQLTSRSIGNIVGRFMTLGGIDSDRRGAHTLRHTFCTRLSEAGVAIEVIAKLAGHADIRTTQRYINVTRDRTVDAIGRTFGRRSPFSADLTTNEPT